MRNGSGGFGSGRPFNRRLAGVRFRRRGAPAARALAVQQSHRAASGALAQFVAEQARKPVGQSPLVDRFGLCSAAFSTGLCHGVVPIWALATFFLLCAIDELFQPAATRKDGGAAIRRSQSPREFRCVVVLSRIY